LGDGQQQQQQQRQQQQVGLLQAPNNSGWLVCWLLSIVRSTWSHLNNKQCSLQHPAWRTLLLPVAELGVALLTAWQAPSSSCSSSSSSTNSSSNGSSSSAATRAQQNWAGFAAAVEDVVMPMLQVLTENVHPEYLPAAAVEDNRNSFHQLVSANPAGASCLMRLLHLPVAWAVQAEHTRLRGASPAPMPAATVGGTNSSSSSSSSQGGSNTIRKRSSKGRSKQQQQLGLEVPAYHEQYLAAVGAPPNSKHVSSPPPPLKLSEQVWAWHMQTMLTCASNVGSSSSSNNSIVLPGGSQHQQGQHQHNSSGSSLAAWRRLETTAAVPGPEQFLLAIQAATLAPTQCAAATVKLLHFTLRTMRCYDDHNDHSSLAAAAELLLQPVLQLLGPTVTYTAAGIIPPGAQGDQGTNAVAATAQELSELCDDYAAVVTLLMGAGERTASVQQCDTIIWNTVAVNRVTSHNVCQVASNMLGLQLPCVTAAARCTSNSSSTAQLVTYRHRGSDCST
jgi:hypothetical protein